MARLAAGASATPKFRVGCVTPLVPYLSRESPAKTIRVSRVFPLATTNVRRHAHLCSGAGHALKPAPLHLYLHLTYSTG